MLLTPFEIFTDPFDNFSYYIDKFGNYDLVGTIGAPYGTEVDGVTATEIATTHFNFIAGNDKNRNPINVSVTGLTTLPATSQGDGSMNLVVQWSWTAVQNQANPIDGFFLRVIQTPDGTPASFPDPSDQTSHLSGVVLVYNPGQENYQYVCNGAMNLYYTFDVIPYRSVAKTSTDNAAVIFGNSAITTRVRPFDKLMFDNVAVSDLNIKFENVVQDGLIEPFEKVYFLKPYLTKLDNSLGSKSEYSALLGKVAGLGTAAQTALTASGTALTSARNSLYEALIHTKFPIANIDNNRTPSGYQSTLLLGSDEYSIADGTVKMMSTGHTLIELTHIIDRAAFTSLFTNYESAFSDLDLAYQLYLQGHASQSAELISTLSDSVISASELSNITARYNTVVTQHKQLEADSALLSVSYDPNLETAFSTLKTALTVTPRIAVTNGVAASTANLAIITNPTAATTARKFASNQDVLDFYSAWDNWYTLANTQQAKIDAAQSSFLSTKKAWSHSSPELSAVADQLTGMSLSETQRQALMAKLNVFNTLSDLKQAISGGVDSSLLAGKLTTLQTVIEKPRTLINVTTLVSTPNSCAITSAPPDTSVIAFDSVADITEIFTAFKGYYDQLAANNAAIAANLTALAGMKKAATYVNHAVLLSKFLDFTLSPADCLALQTTFATTEAKDRTILISSATTNQADSTNFSAAVTALSNSLNNTTYFALNTTLSGLTTNTSTVVGNSGNVLFIDMTKLSALFSLYSTYYDEWDKLSKVVQSNNSYTAKHIISSIVPNSPTVGDYWLNTSSGTLVGVGSFHTSKYTLTGWVQLSDDDAEKHRLSLLPTQWLYTSATEPPNVAGFNWKNTGSAKVSGVLQLATAHWDASRGIWEWAATQGRYNGSASNTADIPYIPYEGSYYFNGNSTDNFRRLWIAKNAKWAVKVILSLSECGTSTPDISSTRTRFYDRVAGVYYTRSKTSLPWSVCDLFRPQILVQPTAPQKAAGK